MISVALNREQSRSKKGNARHRTLARTWPRRIAFEGDWAFSAKATPLPATDQLMMEGGDGRIVCGANGLNRYGCAVHSDPDVLAFGSSTASTISTESFAAANALRDRIESDCWLEEQANVYSREADRLRSDWLRSAAWRNYAVLKLSSAHREPISIFSPRNSSSAKARARR